MTYWTFPLAGIALGILLFCFRMRGQPKALRTLLIALPLGGFFALAGAKLFSLALEWRQWADDDLLWVLSDFSAEALCAVGGCVGACAGVALAGRLGRGEAFDTLDAFAPCGALILAGFRMGEAFLGTLGAGPYLPEGSLLARFPFALTNSWGEQYLAVYTFEAIWAVAAAVHALAVKPARSGDVFRRTAWLLAAGQIFLEDLRSRGMMMGFVHTEQVLCAVICAALCFFACRRRGRYDALWATLALIALFGVTEFGRQKANSAFLRDWGFVILAVECAVLCVPYALVSKEGA